MGVYGNGLGYLGMGCNGLECQDGEHNRNINIPITDNRDVSVRPWIDVDSHGSEIIGMGRRTKDNKRNIKKHT